MKKLTPEQIAKWNAMMDEHVASQRTRPPEMADDYRKTVERAEEVIPDLPKHSHRFTRHALWPDKFPSEDADALEELHARLKSGHQPPARPAEDE